MIDRRGLIAALREEFPEALRKLEHDGKIAPVDLRQAAIGPGMSVFSRYAQVNEASGEPMRVRMALSLINQVLDEKLSQLEGNVSADTRWCVEWFKGHGFDAGPFGEAETLSKGTDTGIAVLDRAGVLRARGGKVTLLSVQDIPADYDPANDERLSEWKICLHLAKRLKDHGADATAQLMAASRDKVDLDDVKELAYLLYSIAEKKGWAETALLFNGLGTSWTDLEDESRKFAGPPEIQGQLLRRVLDDGSGYAMATSNRERVDRALTILAAGLFPFADAVMSAAAPAGQDWVKMLEDRDNTRQGTKHQYSRDDPRFLLKVLTDERQAFRDKLSRAEQGFASELREVGNRWGHGDEFACRDTTRALDTTELLLTAVGRDRRGRAGPQAGQGHSAGRV